MDVPAAVSRAALIGPEVTEATSASFLTSERWVWACGNEIRRFVLNHIFCWSDSLALRLITEASLDHHLACCPLRLEFSSARISGPVGVGFPVTS